MLAGVLTAAGIILAALLTLPIPIVHLFTVIPGPFVAGYIGGGVAKADEGRIITFGLLVAGLMAIPAAVMLVIGFVVEIDDTLKILLIIAGAAVVPYVWWAVTMGALISYLVRRRERRREAPPTAVADPGDG